MLCKMKVNRSERPVTAKLPEVIVYNMPGLKALLCKLQPCKSEPHHSQSCKLAPWSIQIREVLVGPISVLDKGF